MERQMMRWHRLMKERSVHQEHVPRLSQQRLDSVAVASGGSSSSANAGDPCKYDEFAARLVPGNLLLESRVLNKSDKKC